MKNENLTTCKVCEFDGLSKNAIKCPKCGDRSLYKARKRKVFKKIAKYYLIFIIILLIIMFI